MALNPYEFNKQMLKDFSYFTVSEFKCNCRKCRNNANPTYLNAKLLTYLEQMRQHFGKPCVVTSGMRCNKYNRSLRGSAKNSRHLTGNAADVYIRGVSPAEICDYWKKLKVGYCYYGTKNMGNAAHVQIGW